MQSEIPDDVMKAARASTVAYFNSFGAYAEADAVSNKDRDHWGEVQSASWAIMAERERCKAALSAAEPSAAVNADPMRKEFGASARALRLLAENGPDDDLRDGMRELSNRMFRVLNGLSPSALTAQVQDVAGWQDISTAPRDGTLILLVGGAYHGAPFPGLYEVRPFHPGRPWLSVVNNSMLYEHVPTHWMPLPAAPAKHEGKP